MEKRIWIDSERYSEYRLESQKSSYKWSGCTVSPYIASGSCLFRVTKCSEYEQGSTTIAINIESYEDAKKFVENMYKTPETRNISKRLILDFHFAAPYDAEVKCTESVGGHMCLLADYNRAFGGDLPNFPKMPMDDMILNAHRIEVVMLDLDSGRTLAREVVKNRDGLNND